MTGLSRQLKPEEQELLRKREQLAGIRVALAERELELVDLRAQLAAFEGLYLRQVGRLYSELDQWKARILELKARQNPATTTNAEAEEARRQARATHDAAYGRAADRSEFATSSDLKKLFRDAAKRIHPDFAKDSEDLSRRNHLMSEANRAYETGDADTLRRIIDECQDGPDTVEGEGIGPELIRIIRQISLGTSRLASIERELEHLQQSDLYLFKRQADEMKQQGRDLLKELAATVREKIDHAEQDYEALLK
jgi:hypothetical protein